MKKYVIASSALAALILLYMLFPYYSAYKLFSSLKEGDSYELEKYINFGSVRQSLKEQVNALVLENIASDKELQDNPFAALALAVMPKLVDSMIDAYLTPSGISRLIRKGKLEGQIDEVEESVTAQTGHEEGIDFWDVLSHADYAFFTNPSTFLLEIKGIRLQFKLQEWSWKLTGIYLPAKGLIEEPDQKGTAVADVVRQKIPNQREDPKRNREQKQKASASEYWIKARRANVRSGPSTENPIISTLNQGDAVHSIEQQGKWHKIKFGKEKERIGWAHSSLLSKSFVSPAPSIEIANIETRVTESNDVWWKYAWRLTIRNSGSAPASLMAIIEFQDKDGFIIDRDTEYNLYIPANESKTFADYALIDAEVAGNVAQVSAKVRSR